MKRFRIYIFSMIAFGALLFGVNGYARDVKTIHLKEDQISSIWVTTRGTVLSFPTKPTKVILGSDGTFGIEYVENDLAISPLKSNSRSNLFVYMLGRRFTFDLRTSMSSGSSIIIVRDAHEKPRKDAKRGK